MQSLKNPDPAGGRDFTPELVFSYSRSSGPGGQNVNKVNTKAELRFNVMGSDLLSADEKEMVMQKLGSRINLEGELVLTSQKERTQLKNKEAVIARFYTLLNKALTPKKKRKTSRPPRAVKEKRLENKRLQAGKKDQRSKIRP